MELQRATGLVDVEHSTTGEIGVFELDGKLRDGVPVWEVWRDDTYVATHDLVDGPVIDCGAHVGAFSVLAARLGASRVLAFEPHPRTFGRLRQNVSLNGLDAVIECVPYALAAEPGLARIVGDDGGAHVMPNEPDSDDLLITTTTLTEAVRDVGEAACVKLDIEGAEYDVLEALDVVWLERVRHIVMEFHGTGNGPATLCKNAHARFERLLGRLAEHGSLNVVGRASVGGVLRWARY